MVRAVYTALALSIAVDSSVAAARTVMAWANGSPAAVAQLQNKSWQGIFDGVQAGCGFAFAVKDGRAEVQLANATQLAECSSLHEAVRGGNGKFHAWLGNVPQEAIADPAPVLASALALAKEHDLQGFSIDDEYDCAPRSTLDHFTPWVGFIDTFADGLHAEGLELSAAVQAMFGIQDVPYAPLCSPPEQANCSQACHLGPSAYPLEPRVPELMRESKIDRWLEMDTYYFTTGRFFGTLDWYAGAVGTSKLGVSMENRPDISDDGYVARFHAIDASGADWINIFMLPANEKFLPYLRRWKSNCSSCPNQASLSCYDLSVDCEGQAVPTLATAIL